MDELSRGEQYKLLLRIEYEDLIKAAQKQIDSDLYLLNKYVHNEYEISSLNEEIRELNQDITYYQGLLKEKGAENEEILTEEKSSESPEQFNGINCTTVW